MKFKLFAVGLAWSAGLAFPVLAAPDSSVSPEATSVASAEQARIEQQAAQLLTENSPVDVVRLIAQENPQNAPLAIQIVHVMAPEVSLESLVSAAFNAAPEVALAIASMALELGLDATLLPELAIAANIDPTIVAEATAAGPATQSPAPQPIIIRRHPRGSGISPS
ncbi:hypothetical protein [Vibrio mangrovi]|uniref:Uncharacterized protein n=1 Tax=Vibrio mangrovi TaxID=474394 RepID=A0A1Y6IXX3_9VIBR|nr:hypothetical protein [Vibrio mangrovi]MDW6003100.1 hypothetical protein [Vibrio mangrovi]SMS01342.1 hypothetical protein VIM7927_02628 [Vibrio mangrovi]